MHNEGDCRTAPATPGLLKKAVYRNLLETYVKFVG